MSVKRKAKIQQATGNVFSVRLTPPIEGRVRAAIERRAEERGRCEMSDALRELIIMGLDRDEGLR